MKKVIGAAEAMALIAQLDAVVIDDEDPENWTIQPFKGTRFVPHPADSEYSYQLTISQAAKILDRNEGVIRRWIHADPPILRARQDPLWPRAWKINIHDVNEAAKRQRWGMKKKRRKAEIRTLQGKIMRVTAYQRTESLKYGGYINPDDIPEPGEGTVEDTKSPPLKTK